MGQESRTGRQNMQRMQPLCDRTDQPTQALGQSAIFLRDNLPKATTQRWPSTAGAAMSLLDESDPSVNVAHGAAICSKAVLKGYSDQLDCIYEGTQGIDSESSLFSTPPSLGAEE